VSELTVALAVERWATSGVITFADGSDEAPEFVTARHTPPSTPSQDPSLREPRGVADTSGSVAVAALDAEPVHGVQPVQAIAAPEAEAADGPAASRAAFTGRGPPASARTAPGPLEAVEIERAAHPSVAPVQDAVPSEVRTSAPSRAVVLVRTAPAHAVAAAHSSVPYAVAVDDGPLVGCPGRGKPVSGSVATKSAALDAADAARPAHPPPATVHSAAAEVPRASGVTAVSRAAVVARCRRTRRRRPRTPRPRPRTTRSPDRRRAPARARPHPGRPPGPRRSCPTPSSTRPRHRAPCTTRFRCCRARPGRPRRR